MKIARTLKKEANTLLFMNLLLRAMNIEEFEGVIIVASVEELNRLFCVEYTRSDYATLLLRLYEQGAALLIVPDECLEDDGMFWFDEDDFLGRTPRMNG